MKLPLDIERLYAEGVPFAIFRFPGESTIRVSGNDIFDFTINEWNTPWNERIAVDKTAPGVPAVQPWQTSTPHDVYLATTQWLIGQLKSRGGKCVRMRAICASGMRVDINAVISQLFDLFPDAFCHCYYTPRTGMWIGATPEVLAEFADGTVRTMSLAGTRRHTPEAHSWDAKNVEEQAYVTDFIMSALRDAGLFPHAGATETLRYGAIEHICTRIEARMDGLEGAGDILDALNPTPAVAGMPQQTAISEIEEVEDAPRRCYAGYLACSDGTTLRAYVNLRCAQLSDRGWCIYAGGGITSSSDPAAEWRETEAKSAPLLKILKENSLPI